VKGNLTPIECETGLLSVYRLWVQGVLSVEGLETDLRLFVSLKMRPPENATQDLLIAVSEKDPCEVV
jgi:hypothetical protein